MRRLVSVIIIVASMTLPLAAQAYFATVLKATGTVFVKPSGENEFNVAAEMGMGMHIGDAIMTAEDGFVAVIFTNDKSLVKIRKNSEVAIREEFSVRTVKISSGRVLASITPAVRGSFRIETPTSVASVKGTKFWSVVSPQYGDRFYGVEGNINVLNLITGVELSMGPGQMVISTPQGQLINLPVEESDMPQDIDEEAPAPEEPEPIQPEEEVYQPEPEQPTTVAEVPTTTAEMPPEVPEPAAKKSKPYGMGLGLGSVTIDDKIYNQIALRPEVKFGKLGVALDIAIYMDDQGNIRKDEWDEFSDYLDKFYYVRWAQQGDPFFAKLGAMDNVTLGYGILMSGYSNTTEYPQVRKVGVHTGMKIGSLGWEAFVANAKEITGPGLMAGRVTYRPLKKLPLTLGGSVVLDVYPYKGLPDSDDDEVADALDMYPDDDDNKVIDELKTNFTQIQRDYLRSVGYDMPSETIIEKGITKLSDYDRILNGAVSFDIGMPVLKNKLFNVVVYGQAASFFPFEDTSFAEVKKPAAFTPGFGFAAPGVRANILKYFNLTLEYRYAGENFLFNFWDRAYDYERVQIKDNRIFTKSQIALAQDPMQGVFGAFDVNILNYVILGSYYQHMFSSGAEIKSFMATASIPKGKIPKLADAMAFYQRNNDANPFLFNKPSESTILGYKAGFELGGGAVIYYVFQRTYRDYDGNGVIDPKTESVSITTIETGFNF
ncbi:MAG: FecR domain-containing protein [Candidatus Marinimicrobia bacterium]|nr:FecR domain-containing protein [Candidatus Neomarinimicrobiota bacterium]